MFGEVQDNFNSDHFWNAAKVDGQWYYIDPCYNDVYTEVMIRDRVETDGNINHMYFMFSHTTAANLYEGNYSVIKPHMKQRLRIRPTRMLGSHGPKVISLLMQKLSTIYTIPPIPFPCWKTIITIQEIFKI